MGCSEGSPEWGGAIGGRTGDEEGAAAQRCGGGGDLAQRSFAEEDAGGGGEFKGWHEKCFSQRRRGRQEKFGNSGVSGRPEWLRPGRVQVLSLVRVGVPKWVRFAKSTLRESFGGCGMRRAEAQAIHRIHRQFLVLAAIYFRVRMKKSLSWQVWRPWVTNRKGSPEGLPFSTTTVADEL